jgi:ribosomal protein S18 acetylase RimI-like enzyme
MPTRKPVQTTRASLRSEPETTALFRLAELVDHWDSRDQGRLDHFLGRYAPPVATIRPATPADLPGIYRVCLKTGDSGRDATGLWRDEDLLGLVYCGPYVVGQPDLALVVEDEDGIAGYLFGAADTRTFEAWEEGNWWPELRERYPPRDDGSLEAGLIDVIHHPSPAPDDVVAAYPAHLHIDLLEHVRGQGLGRRLVTWLLDQFVERGIHGVHLEVAADNAGGIAFYRRLGFEVLQPHGDALLMGRRLPNDSP